MRERGPRPVRALVTLLALVAGLAGVVGPTPAYADEPVALVEVTLSAMTPALPTRDGDITLTGTVTNITDQRIVRAQAYFWRNQAPITDREGFDQALGSASNDPIGNRNRFVYQNLYEENDAYLEPGETNRFTLTSTVEQLELSPTDGVYLLGVHVLQDNKPVAIGRARVFVPVVETAPRQPVTVTSLVALASRPSLVRPGVLADDHLAGEVAPNGRLTRLLATADTDQTSYAVDPALVEDLQTMAGGYTVLDGDGTVPGASAGAADAKRWLSAFATLRSRRDGYRVLYGSPDLAALAHDRQTSAIKSTAAASRRVEATRALPLLVLPTGGRADRPTVAAAMRLKPRAVVLSDRSAAGPGPLLAVPGAAPIVSISSAVSGGGPGPDPRDTPVQLQQRLLAETWIEATGQAGGSARGRVRLITSADQARANADLAAPWLAPSPLRTVLGTRPAPWSEEYVYPDSVREAELGAVDLAGVRRLTASQRTYAELLVDRAAARRAGSAAVGRSASGAWRGEEQARRAFLDPQQAAVDGLVQRGVEVRSAPRVSTADQQGVVFPITVRNLLPEGADPDDNAIRVRLVFTSDTAQRLTIKPIEFELRAGQNETNDAEVTAKANGVVPVTAQLETESGRKVGKPIQIEVQVTQNGTVGWLIAIAAGVVLIGSTGLRIRTVTRERARQAAADSSEHEAEGTHETEPSGLTSAPPTDLPESAAVVELAGRAPDRDG